MGHPSSDDVSAIDANGRFGDVCLQQYLLRLNTLRSDRAGMGTEDHHSHYYGGGEQAHAESSSMQRRVAKQDPQQAESGAGGAEGEIQAFAGMRGVAQENKEHRGDDGVDGQE